MVLTTRACAILGVASVYVACGDNLRPNDLDPLPPGRLVLRFEPIELDGGELEAITEMKFIPGTMEFLVASKTHTVAHYRLATTGNTTTLLGTFDVPDVDQSSDCGLLAMAFSPQFATDRFVYFAACESVSHSQITRHVFDPGDYGSIARTAVTVIQVGDDAATKAWHNVGSIDFDADGNLWALFGDKNLASSSQDLSTPTGSVIRIVPGRDGGYTPTATNPFIGMTGRDPAIVAYGLRSPWRGALDPMGRLWIGDVGDSTFEEVNVSRLRGENFGNSLAEGPCTSGCTGLTDPVVWWDRSVDHRYSREDPDAAQTTRRVVWVGAAYPRTVAIDRYAGRLFDRMLVGDFAGGWIRSIGLDASDRIVVDEAVGHLEAPSSWAVGSDGYLYASTYGSVLAFPYLTGTIYRAVAAQ